MTSGKDPDPPGKVVKTALVGIEIEFTTHPELGAIPKVVLGINGTPRCTYLDIVVDANGRHIPIRRTVGPDNMQDVGAIINAYTTLSLTWQGLLDTEY